MVALTLTIIFALIVVTFIALTIKIIPQQKVGVVERFGKFQRIMHPGLNILIPIVIVFVYIMTYVFNKRMYHRKR